MRAAYEKLTLLSRGAPQNNGPDASGSSNEDLVLKFELSNFRVGPIKEILGELQRDLVTITGETISLTRSVSQLNQGEEFALLSLQVF